MKKCVNCEVGKVEIVMHDNADLCKTCNSLDIEIELDEEWDA